MIAPALDLIVAIRRHGGTIELRGGRIAGGGITGGEREEIKCWAPVVLTHLRGERRTGERVEDWYRPVAGRIPVEGSGPPARPHAPTSCGYHSFSGPSFPAIGDRDGRA